MAVISTEEIESTQPITDSNRTNRTLPTDPTADIVRVRVVKTDSLYAVQLIHSAEGTTDNTDTWSFTPDEAREQADQLRAGTSPLAERFGDERAQTLADELEIGADAAGSQAIGEFMEKLVSALGSTEPEEATH